MSYWFVGCGVLLLAILACALYHKWMYLSWHARTRDVPPRKGQRWLQGNTVLEIGDRYTENHFKVMIGEMSWVETDEEWKTRVRSRRLILLSEGVGPT